jgi:hypothetical protein
MTDKTVVGRTLHSPQERDAIHIAVACVQCLDPVNPGDHVSLMEGRDDGQMVRRGGSTIGIVDPFLHGEVPPGVWFWVFLYPNTITGLNHVWTHPAFGDPVPITRDAKVEAARAWLESFTAHADCPSLDVIIDVVNGEHYSEQWDEDHLHFQDHDAYGTIPDEFWDNLEVVLGRKLKRAKYFSCSC